MRVHVRISILALVAAALVVGIVPTAAQAAGFGVAKFFAGNCKEEGCGEHAVPPSEFEEATKGYRQAGGHVPFGVTDFVMNTVEPEPGLKVPIGHLTKLRVDVPAGIVTNPEAVTKCSRSDFTSKVFTGTAFFEASTCPASSIIGKNKVVSVVEFPEKSGKFVDAPLEGTVYNLEQAPGLGSEFGVALKVAEPAPGFSLYAHTLIKGSVEWATDYHDYFVIENIPEGLVESRLVFEGNRAGTSGFLRNPTKCTGLGKETTTTIEVESATEETEKVGYESKVGTTGCEEELFKPLFNLTAETTNSDKPDGITTEVSATHPKEASETDTSDLKTAKIVLPEGLTMNPAAAAGLEGCTPEQAGVGAANPGLGKLNPIGCPASSRIGTFTLEVPTLPEGSLQGPIFLGKPAGKPIGGPPYTIYLDAESSRFKIRVLLKGEVSPDAGTGRLTTTFSENPQAPFNKATLSFNGGPFAPLANPIKCETGKSEATFTGFSGATFPGELAFTTGSCPSPAFAPTQATSTLPPAGGGDSAFAFTLTRPEGQQYVEKVSTTLPEGLLAKIAAVTPCPEAQANATQESGAGCPASSLVGTVQVAAGSGTPFVFSGNVYLTGPYNGAPYGLAFKVPTIAGPFNLGEEVTHAAIYLDPYTSRAIVVSMLPTIKGGIPIRMRSLTVDISRPNYIVNPTSCVLQAVESSVISTQGTSVNLSSPFQVEGCSALAFKPSFSARTSGKTSKANGASLETTINQPAGQANIKSVLVTLPKQLPSRLSTLNKACLEATFAINPFACPAGSFVGTVRAITPLLPGKMTGPAIFVSHGGEAFPDLDLVLQGDGYTVILVGHTKITKGITTTEFATNPDAPVSSITVDLPAKSNSALAANGNLCVPTLVMPVVITGQNGLQTKQTTKIKAIGCGVQVVGHKLVGRTAYLTIKTFAAGRISASGRGVGRSSKTLREAHNAVTLKVRVSRGRPHRTKIRVGFLSKQRGVRNSSATVTVG